MTRAGGVTPALDLGLPPSSFALGEIGVGGRYDRAHMSPFPGAAEKQPKHPPKVKEKVA